MEGSQFAGPAHAVYFATYEAVKHAAGGNEGGKHEHHPFAAGMPRSQHWNMPSMLTDETALSGASATIASDALMNPFDGKEAEESAMAQADGHGHSDQAAHAASGLHVQILIRLCEIGAPA